MLEVIKSSVLKSKNTSPFLVPSEHHSYCWTRFLFGISSVPEEFQQRPHDELYGLEGVVNIADDIIVIGQGESLGDASQDHDCTVLHLLNCLKMVGCYINSSRHYLRGHMMTRSQLEQI